MCGAALTPLPIEMAHDSTDPLVVMSHRRTGRGAAAAIAVVAALGTAAFVVGRGRNTATSSPTTTPIPAPTRTTAAVTTSNPTVTVGATTTTLALTVAGPPVLPEPTGQSVYTVNPIGDVYRLDVDTGILTHTDVGRTFQVAGIVAVSDGAMVFDRHAADNGDDSTVLYHVHADGSFDPVTVTIGRPVFGRMAAPDIPGIWLFSRSDTSSSLATLWAFDGGEQTTLVLPDSNSGGTYPDGDGIITVTTFGTYRVSLDGSRRLGRGSPIAISDRFLVMEDCDDRFHCAVSRTDRSTGHVDAFAVPPATVSAAYGAVSGAVSPDGHLISVVTTSPDAALRLGVYDLGAGRAEPVSTTANAFYLSAWTATNWLIFIDGGPVLVLTQGSDIHSIGLPRSPTPIALVLGPTPSTPT
jgi:hypothetical protein